MVIKSSNEDLKGRGYILDDGIMNYQHLTYNELITLLKSKQAYERSIAVRVLSTNFINSHNELMPLFLKVLSQEKGLYTKIEICNALEAGSLETARELVSYLGEIGNNQHQSLPQAVSKKISYPLPRDIIARTLGRMGISVLPVLLSALSENNIKSIREAVDAIGFLCFYNHSPDENMTITTLQECMEKHKNDDIIRWKIAACLSAFKCKKSIQLLNNMFNNETESLIKQEILRSLSLIQK